MDLFPSCSHHAHNIIKVTSLIGEKSKPTGTDENEDNVVVSIIHMSEWHCRGKAGLSELANSLVE